MPLAKKRERNLETNTQKWQKRLMVSFQLILKWKGNNVFLYFRQTDSQNRRFQGVNFRMFYLIIENKRFCQESHDPIRSFHKTRSYQAMEN